jgi:hypothetical protein
MFEVEAIRFSPVGVVYSFSQAGSLDYLRAGEVAMSSHALSLWAGGSPACSLFWGHSNDEIFVGVTNYQ